jgi:hypothetical protein
LEITDSAYIPGDDFKAYADSQGDFIEGHLIDTRMNGRNWRVPNTGERLTKILNERVPGKDFMIDADKISRGVDAHYYGNHTKEQILAGYNHYSHAKYVKVLGPFPYNDGTNDVYYRFIAKLNNSKAASALLENGKKGIVPFSHSAHLWPTETTKDGIVDFDFLGGALVVKGAYGKDATISKLCRGTEDSCITSLSVSADGIDTNNDLVCAQKNDDLAASVISSLVSNLAQNQSYMVENVNLEVTKAPVSAQPDSTTISPQQSSTAPVIGTGKESQTVIQNPYYMTEEERNKMVERAVEEEKKKWQDKVTALETKDKINTLSAVLDKIKVQDEKARKNFIEKWQKSEFVGQIPEILEDILPHVLPVATTQTQTSTTTDKSASSLPAETKLPPKETPDKPASALPVTNKVRDIGNFIFKGGRF